MNIFEGSRRIGKLTASGIAVGFLIAFAYDNPEPVSVSYLITDGKTPPARVDKCDLTSVQENRERTFTNNRRINVALCFKSKRQVLLEAEKRGSLPLKEQDLITEARRRGLLFDLETAVPTDFMSATWSSFTIPESDEGYISRLGWLQTAKSAGIYFLGLLASLLGFGAFTWVVGWIVRGFMGIPQGKDSKE